MDPWWVMSEPWSEESDITGNWFFLHTQSLGVSRGFFFSFLFVFIFVSSSFLILSHLVWNRGWYWNMNVEELLAINNFLIKILNMCMEKMVLRGSNFTSFKSSHFLRLRKNSYFLNCFYELVIYTIFYDLLWIFLKTIIFDSRFLKRGWKKVLC